MKIDPPQNKSTSIDNVLISEIDEAEQSFSLRKWFAVSLLLLVTIICGYFALPTTKTVAVSKSVEQVRDGYVTKNIEDIKVGDEVFAYDVTTGKVSKCKVTDTFERTSDHLRYLTVNDSKGTQTFETTDSHPFWVVTDKPDLSRAARDVVEDNGSILHHENIAVTEKGYYVEAKDLKVGDTFIGASGELSTLKNTTRQDFPNGITVYNFIVENNHNYFVIANLEAYQNGVNVILVHNAGPLYTDNGKVIRNSKLANSKHPETGVEFDGGGYPIFQAEKKVKIKYTGDRNKDFTAANKKAGFEQTPKNMTWHHHQDGKTMELVDEVIHQKTGHTGGFSLY
jgi:hypothetical protein